jgi:hypothetical protein
MMSKEKLVKNKHMGYYDLLTLLFMQSLLRLLFAFVDGNDMTTVESLQFDFATIEAATNKFSDEHNKLGQGGFGVVYKVSLILGYLFKIIIIIIILGYYI